MASGPTKIVPLDLGRTAKAVASSRGARGALIITIGKDGTSIGSSGLTAHELREVLCSGIGYTYTI